MGSCSDVIDLADPRLHHLHDGGPEAAQVHDPQLWQDEADLREDPWRGY